MGRPIRLAISPAVRLPKFPLGTETIVARPSAAGQDEVIEHLRQQPAEIDRIRRRQPHVTTQVIVGERPLDERLAVVERPLDGERRDVVPERRHLRFLDVAHLPFGVEHDHSCIRHSVKRLRHRAARVAGRGDENRQRGAIGEVVQQPRLHAGADVLEGQGRPVKQLQDPGAIGDLNERNREIQRILDQRRHRRRGDLVAEQVAADRRANRDDVGAVRGASSRPGGTGSSRSGMYSPPSGAVPANSASTNEIGGEAPRVLTHFMRSASPDESESGVRARSRPRARPRPRSP